jgi:hypothetical protein
MREKRVIFKMPEKKYADMRIRLRHDGLKQYQLYNWFTNKYLDNDPDILDLVQKLKLSIAKQGKRRIVRSRTLIDQGNITRHNFNLTEDETENLYDQKTVGTG